MRHLPSEQLSNLTNYIRKVKFSKSKLAVLHQRHAADLVLQAEMLLQLPPPCAVIIAELALVGFDLGVLLQVQLQRLVAGAGEGAFVASEHHSLKVTRQLGAADLQRTHALLWR